MTGVTDIGAYREGKTAPDRTLSGPAQCLHCRHQWSAVAPVGTTTLQCPACSLERAVFAHPIQAPGAVWVCGCGNDLFRLYSEGALCVSCGGQLDYDHL